MDVCIYVHIWMIHSFADRGNLCMHTIPNVSVNPTLLSGDLSVLAAFISSSVTVVNFQGCELMTGRCVCLCMEATIFRN